MIRLEVSYGSISFYIFFIPLLIFIQADSTKATEITFESLEESSEKINAPIQSNQQMGYFSYLLTPLWKTFYCIKRTLMGEPKPTVISTRKYEGTDVAVFAFQGGRNYMQDRFYIDENFENTGVSVYAIFDGHSQEFAAKYVVKNLMKSLKEKIKNLKQPTRRHAKVKYMEKGAIKYDILLRDEILAVEKTLLETIRKNIDNSVGPIIKKIKGYEEFVKNNDFNYEVLLQSEEIDERVKREISSALKAHDSGTTALIALIDNGKLFVANVGDSRGVMINNNGVIEDLSEDHKPERKKERKRIEEGGGTIISHPASMISRIDGFSVSRTIGDLRRKLMKHIIADPDTFMYNLISFKPKFIILATDGLWDTFSSKEALEYIDERLDGELYGAKAIAIKAYEKKSRDNITVLVVKTEEYSNKSKLY